MKINTNIELDVTGFALALDAQQAIDSIMIIDAEQADCGFTLAVIESLIKVLENELGKHNRYTDKIKEMLK